MHFSVACQQERAISGRIYYLVDIWSFNKKYRPSLPENETETQNERKRMTGSVYLGEEKKKFET